MLVKSVTNDITRIFIVGNSLQPVRKILKRLCKSTLLNIFLTCLLHFVTEKVRLKHVSHL